MALAANQTSTTVWDFLFVELADPRTNDWPLINSPVPGLTIIGLYLYFVLYWGPKFMENRKPFNFQKTLILYNFLQVLLSVWLVWEALDAVWLRHYKFSCQPVDFTVNPLSMRVCRGFYVYFIAKLTELLDTVFFVLRKKNSQITFLHMYHHTCMPMITWGTVKYFPGGHASFIGMINSFVHIFMYSYYMLAAMGPNYYKYLWWKKYLTILQLAQFLICFYHSLQLLWTPCDYPLFSLVFTLPNGIFFFYLFADFYRQEYTQKSKKKKQTHPVDNNNCKVE